MFYDFLWSNPDNKSNPTKKIRIRTDPEHRLSGWWGDSSCDPKTVIYPSLQYLDTEKETLPVPDTQRILAKKEQKNVWYFLAIKCNENLLSVTVKRKTTCHWTVFVNCINSFFPVRDFDILLEFKIDMYKPIYRSCVIKSTNNSYTFLYQ